MNKTPINGFMKPMIVLYIIYLTGFCFFMYPCPDTFYYFEWSQHLQLSYFDGPPLIAYIIRIITDIFGHTIFALNFVGTISMVWTSYFIYKIGNELAPRVGVTAALIWLVYPFMTTRSIVINVTYDALECLLWCAIIYYTLCYFKSQKTHFIYIIGILGGLLMLSKYQGIILLTGLLLFLALNNKYRKIYYSKDIYLSIILCIIIFSPVIIWNYQNAWISFRFQLNDHLWSNLGNHDWRASNKIRGFIFFLWNSFFCVAHVLILFLMFIAIRKRPQLKNDSVSFLFFLICYSLLFWALVSPFGHVSINYLLPLTSLIIIVSSYYITIYHYNRFVVWLVLIFIIISTSIILDRCSHEKALKQWCRLTEKSCFNKYIKTGIIQYKPSFMKLISIK